MQEGFSAWRAYSKKDAKYCSDTYHEEKCHNRANVAIHVSRSEIASVVHFIEKNKKEREQLHATASTFFGTNYFNSTYEMLMVKSSFLPSVYVEQLQLSAAEVAAAEKAFQRQAQDAANYHPHCYLQDSISNFKEVLEELGKVDPSYPPMLQAIKYEGCTG